MNTPPKLSAVVAEVLDSGNDKGDWRRVNLLMDVCGKILGDKRGRDSETSLTMTEAQRIVDLYGRAVSRYLGDEWTT